MGPGIGAPVMPKSFEGRVARGALLAAGFVVAYALASLYGDHFTGPSHVALYWPASGLAFAVVVIGGWRWALLVPVAFALQAWGRSEARRVGNECVSTFKSRWCPHH